MSVEQMLEYTNMSDVGDIENAHRRDAQIELIAFRRGESVTDVAAEVDRIDDRFDVDAVYVEGV